MLQANPATLLQLINKPAMKLTITTIAILLSIATVFGQSAPAVSLHGIDGDSLQIGQYQGKKIIIVMLPVGNSLVESEWLTAIESSYQQYKDSVTIVGIPSYEDGYNDSLIPALKNWYRNTLHLNFFITMGMYTHNSSGAQQHQLLQWLTTEKQNGHFGTGINTWGQKFVLDKTGQLRAVFDSDTPLDETLMRFIIAAS